MKISLGAVFTASLSEEQLDGAHLVVQCTLEVNNRKIDTHVMIDCGATGYAFVSDSFAHSHRLPLTPLKTPRELATFDGRLVTSGPITHMSEVTMSISNHRETLPLMVTKLSHYPIVLGIPWLRRHDVTTRWLRNSLTFQSEFCKSNCLDLSLSREIKGVTMPDPDPEDVPQTRFPVNLPVSKDKRASDWKRTMNTQLSRTDDEEPAYTKNSKNSKPLDTSHPLPKLDVYMISAAPFHRLTQKKGVEVFAASMRDIEKALEEKPYVDPATILPSDYHEYLDVFSRQDSKLLPVHRPYDHKIQLEEGKSPSFGPLYGMSQDELRVLKKTLEEDLHKGFIRASSSPAASPVLFAKKPGGGLRFCVDYRSLNAITVKNRYPIPLIQETLDRLSKAVIYTKLDVIAAFNRLRIAEGDEWKTAFRTRYGLYEYLVMPFGLTNAPSTFQHYINDTLRDYLDVFCTAYIDDILIYSKSKKEHRKHVKAVLQRLREAGLNIDINKCEFDVTEVKYLGLIVTTSGIRMDPDKISTIIDWSAPTCLRDVQAFVGFANFYRRFIKGFSKIVAPLVAKTKKGTSFVWDASCKRAFQMLKDAFVNAPILRHFDPDREVIVETDASDFVSAGVLSQYDDEGVLHPIAFFSKRHSAAECNYEIYDKELLAIVRVFEAWRPELEGSQFPIQVLSDHKNLEYFRSTKLLSRRQARWSEYLSRFNFKIVFTPGKANGKPDALTRRSQDLPQEGDERLNHQQQIVLKPHNFDKALDLHASRTENPRTNQSEDDPESESDNLNLTVNSEPELDNLISTAYSENATRNDPLHEIMQALRDGERQTPIMKKIHMSLSDCKLRDDRLYYRDLLYIPDHDELRLKLLQKSHDSMSAGHPGTTKTFHLLRRYYFWPNQWDTVKRYVGNCRTCAVTKASRDKYHGLLKPLPIPNQRWKEVSMDFVTDLPSCEGFDSIMAVIDRLTKQRHYIPTNKTITSEGVADLYYGNVWRHRGLPSAATSDRGTQFVSDFWQRLTKRLGIESRLSTAYHPETDGQTENANAVMEQYLRAFVSHFQDDWVKWLPGAEFAVNNNISESTGVTPFFANYGYHPRMGLEPPEPLTITSQRQRLQIEGADEFANHMEEIQQLLKEEILKAQATQERKANMHRTPAPDYKVGDLVYISAKDIKTTRPSKKLDYKNFGPYPVKRVVSPNAYEIQLPPGSRVHPVFSTSRIHPSRDDPLPGQLLPPPPPVVLGETEAENEYEVENVLDFKLIKKWKKLKYLVRYKG